MQHGAKFKVQVATAALAGGKTLAELSSEYGGGHVTIIRRGAAAAGQ